MRKEEVEEEEVEEEERNGFGSGGAQVVTTIGDLLRFCSRIAR